MSITKSLFDVTRIVPETDEVGWGGQVTQQLVDLLDGMDFIAHKNGTNINVRLQAAASSLGAGATLTPLYPVHTVAGAAGAVALAGVANGHKTGQLLILVGTSNVNTVTLDYAAGLKLNGQCVLGDGDVVALLYLGSSVWVELWRNS